MHRHGNKGRKLQRERDQRRALLKGLATSLIEFESIETTLPKAKEVVPYVEKLITKAKKGGQHQQRLVRSKLSTDEAVEKLFEQVAQATEARSSGHLRIEKTRLRRGDNAPMARISFVDSLEVTEKQPVKKTSTAKSSSKKTSKKDDAKSQKKESKQ